MQLIIFVYIVRNPSPANTFKFFTACALVAQLDILDGKDMYETWFDLEDTKPLNDNFEKLDYESKNFLTNSGSYFILCVIVAIYSLVKWAINTMALKCSRFRVARKTGMWAYEKSYKNLTIHSLLKLFLEVYFDITICCFIQLFAFGEDNEDNKQF